MPAFWSFRLIVPVLTCSDVALPTAVARAAATDEVSARFLAWAQQRGFNLSSKVTIGLEGSIEGRGMVALDDIEEGEVLFIIPRDGTECPTTSPLFDGTCFEQMGHFDSTFTLSNSLPQMRYPHIAIPKIRPFPNEP